jgi:DNA-directed RNA polymerase I, II, and III subunit RPABC1
MELHTSVDEATMIRTMMLARGMREIAGCGFAPLDGPEMLFRSQRTRVGVRWYLGETRMGVKEVRQLTEDMRARDLKHVIIVLNKPATTFAITEIHQAAGRIECWERSSLLFDPTTFILTPPHRLLDSQEKNQLAAKTKLESLPKILVTDALSRWFGARRGNIFEITRSSPDGFKFVVHRVVV